MAAQTSTHVTLLNRLQVGSDSQAWGEFVHRYSTLIRAVSLRHGLQPADGDDVVQDVLIALSKALPDFEYDPARARFRTYLQRIVQRTIFRRFRQKSSVNGISDLDTVASNPDRCDEIWEAEWRQYHMRRAMELIDVEFNARDREAFTMYVGAQQPAEETADALGMSVDQVYQAKSRILKRLSALIAVQTEEEG